MLNVSCLRAEILYSYPIKEDPQMHQWFHSALRFPFNPPPSNSPLTLPMLRAGDSG